MIAEGNLLSGHVKCGRAVSWSSPWAEKLGQIVSLDFIAGTPGLGCAWSGRGGSAPRYALAEIFLAPNARVPACGGDPAPEAADCKPAVGGRRRTAQGHGGRSAAHGAEIRPWRAAAAARFHAGAFCDMPKKERSGSCPRNDGFAGAVSGPNFVMSSEVLAKCCGQDRKPQDGGRIFRRRRSSVVAAETSSRQKSRMSRREVGAAVHALVIGPREKRKADFQPGLIFAVRSRGPIAHDLAPDAVDAAGSLLDLGRVPA